MAQPSQGSALLYMLAMLPVVLGVILASALLLRRLASVHYDAIGNRRFTAGYLAMLGPILLFAVYGVTSVNATINEFLAATINCYLYAALLGVPMIVVLQRLGRCSVVWVVLIVTPAVLLVNLLGDLRQLPTLQDGVAHWVRSLRHALPYVAVVTTAFCVGARIPVVIGQNRA